jgi:hypothetical protein
VLCIVGGTLDRANFVADVDTTSVDKAPYVDPEWFRDHLLPCMQTRPSILFGTLTLEATHFSRMCHGLEVRTHWQLLA